ncbi:Gfo/Idh/MocA family protein [Paenibacillus piri]|uniref:Gfo/Idh/MocA family oxidoreductase n=1 Tax=Paenibacillus piri TaxID=2547395 RepID=A0A4R5KND5_9BACL|nr:Gfo/Idh/MocA family oxidoreductase [Paenibacillus piri]TDF96167.1 Gfo/Idh/MocA family oxidoreductase [Paenibacillus piri]
MEQAGINKTYKVVLVGCGKMAVRWVKYALSRKDTEIVACVDIRLEAAEAMAKEHQLGCRCFTDMEEAIKATGANLVFDVTIPEVHKQVVTTAVKHGCDVVGEKPMAATMADAVEVERIVRESGHTYTVMQNRRYLKQIRELRGMIAAGTIGQAGFVTANFFLGPHFGGFREAMDNPLLLDMAIHTFDQARFLLRADPVSVYCHEFNPTGSWYSGNAAAACIFEFSDGTVFTYNGSWCANGAPTSWHADWRVVGSKGTAIWDGTHDPYCSVVSDNQEEGAFFHEYKQISPDKGWEGQEGHDGCFDEMFAALSEGRRAETDSSDNLKSMAMVFGAIKSARTGEKVQIASLLQP